MTMVTVGAFCWLWVTAVRQNHCSVRITEPYDVLLTDRDRSTSLEVACENNVMLTHGGLSDGPSDVRFARVNAA